MSMGWLVAAAADAATGAELAAGFGLTPMQPGPPETHAAALAQLAGGENVGVLISAEAAQDGAFMAFLRALAGQRANAQVIEAAPGARDAFALLPPAWPTLPLEEALRRARIAAERRGEPLPEHSAPEPQQQPEPPPQEAPPVEDNLADEQAEDAEEAAVSTDLGADEGGALAEDKKEQAEEPARFGGEPDLPTPATHDRASMTPPLGSAPQAPPQAEAEPAPAPEPEPAPRADEPETGAILSAPDERPPSPGGPHGAGDACDDALDETWPPRARRKSTSEAMAAAPADATAFAPKKLRRGEAELLRISVHQPRDLQAVIKAARQADPRTSPAPQSVGLGDVALGSSVGVALEVKGAVCDGALQRRTWLGEPIDFAFTLEADADVRQVVILARVFVDDAQIGVLAFTRGVTGPKPKPASNDRVRLKRHKRVFLSYSSHDRETVSAIATAYEMAGVAHFWDRTSLKSGEEWSPRLRREIDRCDLFHLCWSKSAAASEWVEKEATHALNRRRRARKPEITVQMLDGPPWAKHPDGLDRINFDDFVRAAIVGYARGDGEA